jgi:ankyrin repeat protein
VMSLHKHAASGRREPADGEPGADEPGEIASRIRGLTPPARQSREDPQTSKAVVALGRPDVFWAIDQPCPPNGLRYLKWLLEHRADPNESRFSDSRSVHPDAKWIFLQSGDAERTSIIGGAAPIIALAATNSLAEVRMLLEHGADPNRVDGSGRTALTVAAGCGHREMMELLLEYGAEFHVSGAQSPLCSAAACGRLEALEYLVTRGADVNCPNHHGNPPLHISLRNPKSFDALLELGADVNAADAHGQTPLHLAAEMQDVELMTRLLKLGADPGRKNAAGETPIAIAARLGPQAIVELLRSTPSTPEKP